MRRSIPILLTLTVLLLSAGEVWSADLQKGVDAAKRGDYATALREWKPLAEQGDANAQYKLGWMYDNGLGVPKNYETAVKFWHLLEAEQGSSYAQHNLGWLYQQGKGVPKNNKIAVKWWTRAAKQGSTNALFYKGLLYLVGPGEIQDNIFARLFNNISVSSGIGIYDNAAYWYLLAATQGHAEAQNNLGVMYKDGKGVAENFKAATKWFRLAAEQGNVNSQYQLGWIYTVGTGSKQDIVYAHMWLNLVASRGQKGGMELRDKIARQMTPSQLAEAQKLAGECVRKKYQGC
jgi:uncharacterized protein